MSAATRCTCTRSTLKVFDKTWTLVMVCESHVWPPALLGNSDDREFALMRHRVSNPVYQQHAEIAYTGRFIFIARRAPKVGAVEAALMISPVKELVKQGGGESRAFISWVMETIAFNDRVAAAPGPDSLDSVDWTPCVDIPSKQKSSV